MKQMGGEHDAGCPMMTALDAVTDEDAAWFRAVGRS
jgi:hypothetical protein